MKSYFKPAIAVCWGAAFFGIGPLMWNPLFTKNSTQCSQAMTRCSGNPGRRAPIVPQQHKPSVDMSKEFVVLLSVEFYQLQKDQPAFAILHLENHSSQDLDLKRVFKLNLIKRGEAGAEVEKDSFWSPLAVIKHLPLEVTQNQTGKLKKGETIEIRFDVTKLEWGRSTLSVYPSDNLFDVVSRGHYVLRLDVRTDVKGKGVNQPVTGMESNELPIFVENDKEIDW